MAATLIVVAATVKGDLRILMLVLAVVAGLPAVLLGLVMVLVAAIELAAAPIKSGRDLQAARRVLGAALVVVALLAAAGVSLYAQSPGVTSYQVSVLLVLPLFAVALWYIGRRLPSPLRWALAVLSAAIGSGGYILEGGAQWWNWGQFAVYPLVALTLRYAFAHRGSGLGRQSFGNSGAGPFGPP